MAFTIPTLTAPRIDERAQPVVFEQANHQAGEFGASVVASAAGTAFHLADQYRQIQAEEKHKADVTAVQEALNTQRDANDSNLEFLRRQEGRNAAEAAQEVYKDADKRAKSAYEGLANDEQKTLFTQEADKELSQMRRIGEAHVGQQIEVDRDRTFQGSHAISVRRATTEALVPGVAEEEAQNVKERTAIYAKAKGLGPEAAKSFEQQQVGQLYSAQIRTLMGLPGGYEVALEQLNKHRNELADDLPELEAKVEHVARIGRADVLARKLEGQFTLPNKSLDFNAGKKELERLFPKAGPDFDASMAAWQHRVSANESGTKLVENQYWDNALGSYQRYPVGTSYEAWQSANPKLDADLTPDQRQRIMDRARADQHFKENQKLEPWQEKNYLGLMIDIDENADLWGSVGEGKLMQDRRYSTLPERYRVAAMNKVEQTHRERNSPEGVLKSVDQALRASAVSAGILSDKTKNKPFSAWDESDQLKWKGLQDAAAPAILAFKKDPKNNGLRFPNVEVDRLVRDYTRTYTIKGGGFLETDKTGVSAEDAANSHLPVIPELSDSEVERGRKVQLLRGFDPAVSPGYFAPDQLLAAEAAWSRAQAGPPPEIKASIVEQLQANNRATDDATVRQVYERSVLKYAPKPAKPKPTWNTSLPPTAGLMSR
jgi:hypothetical protein